LGFSSIGGGGAGGAASFCSLAFSPSFFSGTLSSMTGLTSTSIAGSASSFPSFSFSSSFS